MHRGYQIKIIGMKSFDNDAESSMHEWGAAMQRACLSAAARSLLSSMPVSRQRARTSCNSACKQGWGLVKKGVSSSKRRLSTQAHKLS